MGRAPCCDKANVKKGPWSPEEDAKLKSYIDKSGTGGNWIALLQKIGLKRCGKSCRLRWLNYLRPNIKHGGFSEEEDNIICTLYSTIGSRWSVIAAQLPGRTDNDIKNYWNTKLKKKLHLQVQSKKQYYCSRDDNNISSSSCCSSSLIKQEEDTKMIISRECDSRRRSTTMLSTDDDDNVTFYQPRITLSSLSPSFIGLPEDYYYNYGLRDSIISSNFIDQQYDEINVGIPAPAAMLVPNSSNYFSGNFSEKGFDYNNFGGPEEMEMEMQMGYNNNNSNLWKWDEILSENIRAFPQFTSCFGEDININSQVVCCPIFSDYQNDAIQLEVQPPSRPFGMQQQSSIVN